MLILQIYAYSGDERFSVNVSRSDAKISKAVDLFQYKPDMSQYRDEIFKFQVKLNILITSSSDKNTTINLKFCFFGRFIFVLTL